MDVTYVKCSSIYDNTTFSLSSQGKGPGNEVDDNKIQNVSIVLLSQRQTGEFADVDLLGINYRPLNKCTYGPRKQISLELMLCCSKNRDIKKFLKPVILNTSSFTVFRRTVKLQLDGIAFKWPQNVTEHK